eukprot:754506-Hanusia_phi.AAC.1
MDQRAGLGETGQRIPIRGGDRVERADRKRDVGRYGMRTGQESRRDEEDGKRRNRGDKCLESCYGSRRQGGVRRVMSGDGAQKSSAAPGAAPASSMLRSSAE